jgi:N-acetylmuramoyl-L-alanine amidase
MTNDCDDAAVAACETSPLLAPAMAAAAMQVAPPVLDVAPDELDVVADWLVGSGVTRMAAHPSWFGGTLSIGKPLGLVAHYTATGAGTAIAMAKRRARVFGADPDDRIASWHITIEADGSIVVMIPCSRVAWHAGSSSARPVPGLGNANANTLGIELVGFGTEFSPPQVSAACRVWRALVKHYGIAREHAMITHQSIDPERRSDPGPVWMNQHAANVLDFAYRT